MAIAENSYCVLRIHWGGCSAFGRGNLRSLVVGGSRRIILPTLHIFGRGWKQFNLLLFGAGLIISSTLAALRAAEGLHFPVLRGKQPNKVSHQALVR